MKKIITLLSVNILLGIGATTVFGEESVKETKNSQLETVASTEKKEEKLIQKTSELLAEIEKEKMFFNAYLTKGYITQTEYDNFILRLNNANTSEELKAIMDELYTNKPETTGYRWTFGEKYVNINANIKGYVENGKLSKEQGDKFLQRLEAAKNLDEIDQIDKEIQGITGKNQDTAVTSEDIKGAKWRLEVLLVNSYITQTEYDGLLAELNAVKIKSELETYENNVDSVSKAPEMFLWSMSEAYINIRANISTSLKDGKISQEQADKLFAQLDAARTRAELDKVSVDLNKLLEGKKDPGTSTSETNKNNEKVTTTNSNAKPAALPKTGETNNSLLAALGVLIASSGIGYYIFRKK